MKKLLLACLLVSMNYLSYAQLHVPQVYLTFDDNTIIPDTAIGVTNGDANGTVNLVNPAGTYSQTNNSVVSDANENVLFKDFEGYLKFDERILNKHQFTLTANYKRTGNNAWWLGLISFVGKDEGNYIEEHLQIKNPTGSINGLGLSAVNVLPQDTYHHVALTYNLGRFALYVDGAVVATSAGQTIHRLTDVALYLGLKTNTNSRTGAVTPYLDPRGFSKNTKVYLDNIALFDSALSATEVASIYNNGIPTDYVNITVSPEESKQKIVFGGDAKLTIKDWAEGNIDEIAKKLYQDMDLKILRIPIFALQPITNSIYDNVISVVNAVKRINPDVKIFASIANGDGYGVNHHGASKFPRSWRGCCSQNVYSMNLSIYAAYLDRFMDRMTAAGITIDYLGPWNEDNADSADLFKVFDQMNNLGSTQRVGLERLSLRSSVNDVNDVEDQIDITGSHFYDDRNISKQQRDAVWRSLVNKSANPVWYTESTRYKTTDSANNLVNGLENIFPAMRAGVESISFYQACTRFVRADGSTQDIKYTGFQNLVNNSEGNVRPSTSDNINVSVVAFAKQDTLDVHIINKNATERSVKLQLSGDYMAKGAITRTIWTVTDTAAVSTYRLENVSRWLATVPGGSYSHLKIPLNKVVATTEQTPKIARRSLNFGDNPIKFEPLEIQSFKVFPNPSQAGELTLDLPQSNVSKVQIELFSLAGQLVSIEVLPYKRRVAYHNNLEPGSYLIKVTLGEQFFTHNIIITD